jgi:hypothetical protein
MNELDDFINTMLKERQLPPMDEEVRVQIVADLKKDLLDQIDKALINALPEDKLQEFNTLLDSSDVNTETLQGFIKNSGIDVADVTVRTMVGFRALYLQGTQGA